MPTKADPRKHSGAVDITEEYMRTATPNSHVVQDLQEYSVNGATYRVDGLNVVLCYSAHGKEIAELLERKLGGELYMAPKVNAPQGVRTPDYLFRGIRYDLKTLTSKATGDTIFQREKGRKDRQAGLSWT